jgi:uncharacterized protein (DUF58 family)
MDGRPTRRGGWTLVLGLTALGAALWWWYPGLMALGAAFTVLVGVAYASIAVPAALTASRTVEPIEVPRFGRCTATLTIVHTGRMASPTVDGVERVGDEELPVIVPRLRPGGRVEVAYPIPTRRRGLLRVGPLLLHRRAVAGLAVRTERVSDVVDVRVLPRILRVRGLPPGTRRGHIGAEERVAHGGTDLVGLREYAPGDDLRRLHWATSARTGTLMVREDADPALPHLAILLDDRAPGYGPDDFEDAVEVAASLVCAASAVGHPVVVRTVSGSVEAEVAVAATGAPDPRPSNVLAALAGVSTVEAGEPPAPVPQRDLDVFAVVTGAGADLAGLVLQAARAPVGVVLVVDPRPVRAVQAVGSVLVLRGPRAEELLHSWDHAVLDNEAGP